MLSKAEALLKQRKESIDLLDEFLKSTFLDMFGDPILNEKGWKLTRLSNVCKKIGSGSTPRGGKESYIEEGISLIRSLNVHNNEFVFKDLAHISEKQAYNLRNVIVEKDDVLLNITGASVARSCIVPEKVIPARVNQHVSIIRTDLKILIPCFLNRVFTSENYQNYLIRTARSKGATREAITKEEIELFKIPVPPISLQNQFVLIVEKTETLKSKIQVSLHELENLFGSLSQRAFKGKLDLSKIGEEKKGKVPLIKNIADEIEKTISQQNEITKPIIEQTKQIEKIKKQIPSVEVPPIVIEAHKSLGKIKWAISERPKIPKIEQPKTWKNLSVQQIANKIKDNYKGYHFNFEMVVRLIQDSFSIEVDYYSSEELKQKPQLNEAVDLKSLISSALNNANPFIELEQLFYNGEEENFPLKITSEDYKLIKDRSAEERSGIYFKIIK